MGPESGGRGSCCQQVAEKLEKSEAGRKKLRQAITLLKEKLEATEKVLQVNETLRQELEKERKRAEAESLNATEQMRLREELEKDGRSLKDELSRVFQRLDAVERRQKLDSNGVDRLLSEVREAAKGLGHSVVAIESAQNSFQGLEKSLLTKIQSASKSAEKGMDLATKLQSDASTARTKCVAAETMSRTAQTVAISTQTEVQKLSANVVALQKHTSLMEEQLCSLLQGRGRTSEVKATAPTPATRDPLPNAFAKSKSKSKFGRGMVLSKTQVQSTPLIQVRKATNGGSDLVDPGEMVSNTSSAPLTTGAVQSERIPIPSTSKPASVRAVDTLSAHVESLEKHNSWLEQRISTLLQDGAQTDDTGKVTFTMDVVGDRMSSGHIRPRNRSKAGKETFFSNPQLQTTLAVKTSEPCKADSKKNGIAQESAQNARPEERKEGYGEKMSQMCSLTELSVKTGALTDNLVDSRRKESSSEDKPMAIVQSITRLLQKGNKNQTKMQSKLEALEEALVNIQSKGNGNVCSADGLQKEGEKRPKRKAIEKKELNVGIGDGDACISQKNGKCKERRKRARKEDSTHGQHIEKKIGVTLEADAALQPADKINLSGTGYPLEVATQPNGKSELHEQVKLKVDPSCLDLGSEDGEAVWLNSCVTERDIPVWSEWDLKSGCDDPLWADWLAGKLQLLSPLSPIIPVGAENEGICVVDVGHELIQTKEAHSEDENSHLSFPQVTLVDMQGADGNCSRETWPSNCEGRPQVSVQTFLIERGSSFLDLSTSLPEIPIDVRTGSRDSADVAGVGVLELVKSTEPHIEVEDGRLDVRQVISVDAKVAAEHYLKQSSPSNSEAPPRFLLPTTSDKFGRSSADVAKLSGEYPAEVDEKLPVIQPVGGDHGWKDLCPTPVHSKSCHSGSTSLRELAHEGGAPADGKGSGNVIENSSVLQSVGNEGLTELPRVLITRIQATCALPLVSEISSEDAVHFQGGGPEKVHEGCDDACEELPEKQDH